MPKKTPATVPAIHLDLPTYARLLKRQQIQRARTWRQIQQGKRQANYWRDRWASHPETMGANLRRINDSRKAQAHARTDRLLAVLNLVPVEVKSWDLRPSIASALDRLGHASDKPAVERFLSAIRRRNLITFDASKLAWILTQKT
jgi:hypothetical protein